MNKYAVLIFMAMVMGVPYLEYAQSVLYIKGCASQETRDQITKAIKFVAKNVEKIRTEEYSYINHVWEYAFEIDGQNPFYILDSDRYKINLSDQEVASFNAALFKNDVTVRCTREESAACEGRGGYASTADNLFHKIFFNMGEERLIVLCKPNSYYFCGLVKTIAHEFAHIADIEMSPKHNLASFKRDGDETHRLDKVYMIGKAMENRCWDREERSRQTVKDGITYYTER